MGCALIPKDMPTSLMEHDLLEADGETIDSELGRVSVELGNTIEVAVIGLLDPMPGEVPAAFAICGESAEALRSRIMTTCRDSQRLSNDLVKPASFRRYSRYPQYLVKAELRTLLCCE